MSTSEMKSKLLQQLDLLDKNELEEAFGVLQNYINGKSNEWDKLTKKQQDGILKAVKQLDAGQGIPHKTVMRKYRKKYA